MKFIYNDGGRAAAGFKGSAGDCVVRAVAIAAELPYQQVYDALAEGTAQECRTKHSGKLSGRRTASSGIHTGRKWFKDFMASLGWVWTPTMQIGSGCKVHLTDGELPMGRLIVSVSKHITTVIDGVIHDTYDPQREGEIIFASDGTRTQGGGRCVYGYWRQA
jgi:hypothetical protein